MGTLAVWVRWKESENPDIPLKGSHIDSLTCRFSLWVLAEGQQLRKYKRHIEKK